MLEECKSHCDWLIVGIQTDPTIDRPEKNKPIQSLEERIGQIRAVRYVDEVMVYATEKELHTYLLNHPPTIRFLGSDWENKKFTGHELPIVSHFCSREHKFSSSELRKRIAKQENCDDSSKGRWPGYPRII
jgi:glycerol-3-phosphate cytidylyltransferase